MQEQDPDRNLSEQRAGRASSASRGLSVEQVKRFIQLAKLIASKSVRLEEIFSLVLELSIELTGADGGSIYLIDETGQTLTLAAISRPAGEPSIGDLDTIDLSLPIAAVVVDQPLIVPDEDSDHGFTSTPSSKIKSMLASPLKFGDEVVGVLNLDSNKSNHFGDGTFELVELLSSLLGFTFLINRGNRIEPSLDSPSERISKGTIIVMMPFHEPFNKYYQAVFKPAVEDAGFSILRVDEMLGPKEIMRDLWDAIQSAKVVLAELTGRNPNVMYEVGLSHGIGKPVILVSQTLDDIPFDLRALRVLIYDTTDPEWASNLRASITKSIMTTLEEDIVGPYSTRLKQNPH